MNTRLLGALCIIGSLIGVADGVRQVLIGTTHEGTFRNVDTLNYVQIILWSAGTLCAVLALIALKATGTNPVFSLLSWLPVVGNAASVVGALVGLTGVPTSENLIGIVGQLLSMAGMVVVAILVLAARVWRGWRAFTPLLTVLAIPLGAVVAGITGDQDGWWIIINAAASALLGYAILGSVPAARVRDDYAVAASA